MVSLRCQQLKPSPTLAATAKAKKMKSEGIDVLAFTAGEPDFDTPDFVKEAAIKSIKDGFTKYTPSTGIPELKKAVIEKFKRDNNINYELNQITISVGAKHCLYNAIMALCDPGDEAILFAPYWPTYADQLALAGAKSVSIPLDEKNNYSLDIDRLKKAITPKTKLILINTPSNPTGGVLDRSTLEQIAEIALQHDLWVITDEIYEKIVYDGFKPVSIASFSNEIYKKTITINGLSKSHSMTGWRIGYAGAPAEVASAMSALQDQATSNPTSFAQVGALAALQPNEEFINTMLSAFDERRKFLINALNDMPGVTCTMPKGAFYAMPNISSYFGKGEIINATAFQDWLLDKHHVAVVAGSPFEAPNNIRLSFATDLTTIKKGVERIRRALASLK